jgi:N-acetyl sugar amidotransferase
MKGDLVPEFDALVQQIREAGRGREYDCIVGLSGGVDSTYVLLKAVEAGLRPLAVHFDSGWNSELAVQNIQNATAELSVDLETDVVNWREMRDLQLAFFKAGVENCDIPTDHAFPAVALRSAVEHGAKYILSGGNLATESVLPRAWGHNASDVRYLRAIHRRFGTVPLKTYPTLGILKKQLWYQTVRRVKVVRPLDLMPYRKDAAKAEIAEKIGWRDYGGKHHESVFTRFFQGYYLPARFGYDKRLAHYSSLILSGQMTREDALRSLVNEPPYQAALQQSDLAFVAKKVGLSPEELLSLINRPLCEMEEFPTNDSWYSLAMALRQRIGSR